MVDTVISFERNNDDIRFLHAQKNRFGSVDELGIFKIENDLGFSTLLENKKVVSKLENSQFYNQVCLILKTI
jgi:predicted ATP-dependent serine protease